MSSKTTKTVWTSLGFALAVSFGFACGTPAVEDYCKEKCDCEDCNDKELEECLVRREGRLERAALYGCDDYYLEYLECLYNKGDCNDDHYGDYDDRCGDEQEDQSECIDDARKEELIDT